MRGLLVEGATSRLSLLQATARVLVSGLNCLGDGTSDNESALGRTKADNYEIEDLLNPEFPIGADCGVASLSYNTLNSWFSPDVISMMAAQAAAPSEWSLSDADEEPPVKKLCCIAPSEPWSPWSATSLSEDQTLESLAREATDRHTEPPEYPAQAEVANTVQQHVASEDTPSLMFEQCEDWTSSNAWSDSPSGGTVSTETLDCDATQTGALVDQQAASDSPSGGTVSTETLECDATQTGALVDQQAASDSPSGGTVSTETLDCDATQTGALVD